MKELNTLQKIDTKFNKPSKLDNDISTSSKRRDFNLKVKEIEQNIK